MTVAASTRKAGPFLGNGVTNSFPFTFKVFTKADLQVTKTDVAGVSTALTLDSHYSVTLNADQDNNPGGTITYPASGPILLATGESLLALSNITAVQDADVSNASRFLPQVLEDALDKQMMLIQQLSEVQSRSLTVSAFGGDTLPLAPLSFTLAKLANVVAAVYSASAGPLDALSFLSDATGAVSRSAQKKLREVSFSPGDVGAVGDGVTDDGIALLAALAWMRVLINAAPFGAIFITLDLAGKTYATTRSLNGTGLVTGWGIKNGAIIGKCMGKAVLDLIGSRSGNLDRVVVYGDPNNRPSVGIQTARAATAAFAFCDGHHWRQVFTKGYFSTAAVHVYGQEGSVFERCQFWNSDKDAYVGIHTGYSLVAMTSDYLAPMTGAASYINDKYINCDWLPLLTVQGAITGITKANPAVITMAGHPFTNGMTVSVGAIGAGMTEINNLVGTVSGVTVNTFALTGINSTGFSTYTGGGTVVQSQTKPTILFSRGAQHNFDTCYCVNYGSNSIQIDFADGAPMARISMDFLFEGQGSSSHIQFANVGSMPDFSLSTYNTCCRDWVISTLAVAGSITLQNAKIVDTNSSFSNPNLFDTPARYAVLGGEVIVPSATAFGATTLGLNFNGRVHSFGTGASTLVNLLFADSRDTVNGAPITTTPIASTVGAINVATSQLNYRRIGKLVKFEINVTVTDNGTGAGILQATLPFITATAERLVGTNASNNKAITGSIAQGGSTLSFLLYDGTYPVVSGQTLVMSGWLLEA